MLHMLQSGPKKQTIVLQVATSLIMDQFQDISLLENLLNFQKDARDICHMPSKCYHFTLQNGKQCRGASLKFCKSRG